MISGKFTLEETNRRIYERVLREYLKRLLGDCQELPRSKGVQVLKLLDTLRIETKFSQGDFDFTGYYQQFQETEEEAIRLNATAKAEQLLCSPL
jgi:hypothetical protein